MGAVTQDFIAGWGGWVAVIGLVLNNAWSSYKNQNLDKAAGSAHLDLINRLSEQLEAERKATQEERRATQTANERADRFAQERNEMHQMVGEMKGEMKAMRQEITALTQEVSELKEKANVQIVQA